MTKQAPSVEAKGRAQKRIVTTEVINAPDVIETGDDPDDEPESPEMEALSSLFGEIGNREGIYVNVYRMPQTGQKGQEYCFRLEPGVDSMDMGDVMNRLQNDYGPGRYLLVARDSRLIVAKESVTIAASRSRVNQQQGSRESVQQSPQIVEAISAAIKPLADALAATINQPKPDPMAQMRQMVEMMGLVKALQPAPAASASVDPLADLERLQRLRSILGDGGGGGGGEKSMIGELLDLYKTVGQPLIEQLIAAKTGGALPTGIGAAGGGLPAAASMLPAPMVTMPAMPGAPVAPPSSPPVAKSPVEVFTARLQVHAQKGTVPEVAATELLAELDNVPPQVADQVLQFVETESAIPMLLAQVPALANSRSWLEAVRAEVLRLTEPDAGNEQPDNENELVEVL